MMNITSLIQRKSISVCICIAREQLKSDPDAYVFTVELGKFKWLAGIGSKDNRDLKQALRGLVTSKIEYNLFGKDKEVRGVFNFLSHVKITDEGAGKAAYIQFEFPTPIREAVKHPRMYARLDLLILRSLTSKYALATYEVLKDYQNLGVLSIPMEQFRKRMGLQAHEYEVVTMLRKRIVDKAVEEINQKTDLNVSYELIKTGKTFSHIRFDMRPRATASNRQMEISQTLAQRGFNEKTVSELLQKHDRDYITSHMALVEDKMRRRKVLNPAAYLMKGLQTDFRTKKLPAKPAPEQEQEQEEHSEKLQRAAEKRKREQIDTYLSELPSEEIQTLQNQCYTKVIESKSLFKNAYAKRGFAHPAIQAVFRNYVYDILNNQSVENIVQMDPNAKV